MAGTVLHAGDREVRDPRGGHSSRKDRKLKSVNLDGDVLGRKGVRGQRRSMRSERTAPRR